MASAEDATSEYPLAAQIPLPTFSALPAFPPSASHLRSLTLTSDIPLPEYQSLLSPTSYDLPVLPASITHLTLELFSLGFPGRNPRFLSNLAAALPNLEAVTVFGCLLDGLGDESRGDAVRFWEQTQEVREVHAIDCFVRPGFWGEVGRAWGRRNKEEGVKVVEVSYTYRGHEDSDFLARCHGEELAELLVSGLVGFACGLVEEAEGDKDLAPGKEEEAEAEAEGQGKEVNERKGQKGLSGGVLPYASDSRATKAILSKFKGSEEGALAGLKVLNLSLWTLTAQDVGAVLRQIKPGEGGTGLIDLTMAVLMGEGWVKELADAFAAAPDAVRNMEALEIVGVPSMAKPKGTASGPGKMDEQIDNIMDTGEAEWGSAQGVKLMDVNEVEVLGEKCPRLAKVEMSILKARKAGVVVFVRDGPGEKWKKG